MKKHEVIETSSLKINPFSYTLQLPVTQVFNAKTLTKDPEDGSWYDGGYMVEQVNSIKIYDCNDCKDVVFKLSPSAKSLYLYILYTVNRNQDWIQIHIKNCMDRLDIKSINTYKAAITDLIDNSFIAGTKYKTVFWINPNLFFNGNRLKKYPKSVLIKDTWDKKAKQKDFPLISLKSKEELPIE